MKTWISVALLAVVCFFQKGDCTITLWTNPDIAVGDGGNGPSTTYVNHDETVGATSVTLAATSDAVGGVTAYTLVSQSPSDVTFTIANTGIISIGSGTASFATNPVYTLEVSANDAGGTAGTATVTLSINDVPAFTATQIGLCIQAGTAANTVLSTLAVTDTVNTGTLTYAIAGAGNTNTDWSITAAGALTTANAMATTLRGYQLVITAAESPSNPLTGTTTVWIIVPDTCGGAAAVMAGCITLLMALMAHLY